MSAGISSNRTTKASNSTPTAMPNPRGRIIARWLKTNPPNTEIMMIAAAMTTARAPRTPATTAARAGVPCTKASRIPEAMKSW